MVFLEPIYEHMDMPLMIYICEDYQGNTIQFNALDQVQKWVQKKSIYYSISKHHTT